MDAKILVDRVRATLAMRGRVLSMAKGRDLIARLLYGKAYGAAIAAEKAGVLPQPRLIDERTALLREAHPHVVDEAIDAIGVVLVRISQPNE